MGERKKISNRVRGNTKLILMAADQDPSLSPLASKYRRRNLTPRRNCSDRNNLARCFVEFLFLSPFLIFFFLSFFFSFFNVASRFRLPIRFIRPSVGPREPNDWSVNKYFASASGHNNRANSFSLWFLRFSSSPSRGKPLIRLTSSRFQGEVRVWAFIGNKNTQVRGKLNESL